MSDDGSGGTRSVENLKNSLSLASMILTLVFGTILSGWLKVVETEVGEAKLAIDRFGAASNYMSLIGDESAPPYLKSIALASMLRFDLMEPDLLFSTGYMVEDSEGPGVMQQLMYEYAKRAKMIETPIGYVDLPGELRDEGYVVRGWALDDQGVAEISIFLNGVPYSNEVTRGTRRPDIESLYRAYEDTLDSGFEFTLPADLNGSEALLEVRLIDEEYHFMRILSSRVCFRDRGVLRSIGDGACSSDDSRE